MDVSILWADGTPIHRPPCQVHGEGSRERNYLPKGDQYQQDLMALKYSFTEVVGGGGGVGKTSHIMWIKLFIWYDKEQGGEGDSLQGSEERS